jgi:hypothetical protein
MHAYDILTAGWCCIIKRLVAHTNATLVLVKTSAGRAPENLLKAMSLQATVQAMQSMSTMGCNLFILIHLCTPAGLLAPAWALVAFTARWQDA